METAAHEPSESIQRSLDRIRRSRAVNYWQYSDPQGCPQEALEHAKTTLCSVWIEVLKFISV